ncbi:MAG TPA: ATP-dependent DNA helicase RecG [candidate division WOR-3 bacterium]|uniref:ATP-dependent DNA helicase RecG n=1 Tax=candidate division WOR-3 bacterium TaxID=2052148 RepID=A0A7C0ZE01_UNCW3|nr:ATP-dependent DNA helicase RecG [candidate division WOR-3 bacterium]
MDFNPVDSPVKYVKGVGPVRERYLNLLGIYTIRDLLFYPPRKYIDSSVVKSISQAKTGEDVTIIGEVVDVFVKRARSMKIGTVVVYDGTGTISAKWFNQDWVVKYFKKGETVSISGKISMFGFEKQIISPEYEKLEREDYQVIHTGRIVPVYRINKFLTQRSFRRYVKNALERYVDRVEEYLMDEEREMLNLIELRDALRKLHFPEKKEDVDIAVRRLAFDELFFVELFLRLQKIDAQKKKGIAFNTSSNLAEKLLRSLPFKLTDEQLRVIDEIKGDMAKPVPMQRLLQGDVGSGKTIVALIASLICIENGYNVGFMVPTEILAFQHHRVLSRFLKDIGVDVYLISGGMKNSEKERILETITQRPAILVGTHALIQKGMRIPKMGLAIIDEQHRFGVLQRKRLITQGESPDVLFLTATPIPRTLALAVYGDLDVSTIRKLPPGRIPPKTRWVNEKKREKVYQFVRDKISDGELAYIVLPVIEENPRSELKAVKTIYKELKNTYVKNIPIEMLYGGMKSEEKDRIMNEFREGRIKALVCTTVIEVGVDVPDANIMVIENADRFGLSQLHQLRGRIGRGGKKSYCILITPENITEDAGKRLRAMEEYTDGFKLAEVDLKIRGPGEFFGTRQHGFSDFVFFDIFRDSYLIEPVKRFVDEVVSKKDFGRFVEGIERISKRGDLIEVG